MMSSSSERQIHLKTIALGLVFDYGRAFPAGLCAAVVFHDHQSTGRKLFGPLGNQHGVQLYRLSLLSATHHYHKIRDGRVIQAELPFGRGLEVFHLANLDPDLAGPAEPGIEVPAGLDRTKHQRTEVFIGLGDNQIASGVSPVRVFPPQHFQGFVLCVGIAVDYPYRPLPGHFLCHQHLGYGAIGLQDIPFVLNSVSPGIESNDGLGISVPLLGKRPVNLDVRGREGLQPGIRVLQTGGCFGGIGGFPEEVPKGSGIGFRLGRIRFSHAAARIGKELLHPVLLIVSVGGR